MGIVSGLHIPLGLIAMGVLFLAVAWLAIAEYWRSFRSDPQAIMSLEVLANIAELGGPGYLAILAIVAGLPMFLAGAAMLVVMVGYWAIESSSILFRVLGISLGPG